MTQRSRAWTFTLNNYNEDDIEMIKNLIKEGDYLIMGKEIGEKKKTPHLQGYVHFKNARTFDALQKKMKRAHIEKAYGDAKQNRVYCTKCGDDYIEIGELPIAGKRTDIETVKEMLTQGSSMREIVEEATSFQGIRFAEKYLSYNEKKRDWKPLVYWFYGETGTGKTRQAIEMFKNKDFWISGKDLRWFDGYDGHENVIIDDFRGSHCTMTEMLRLLDRYPYRVEVKGGSRQFLAKTIVITSPMKPEDCYRTVGKDSIDQLLRRIDVIQKFH